MLSAIGSSAKLMFRPIARTLARAALKASRAALTDQTLKVHIAREPWIVCSSAIMMHTADARHATTASQQRPP